MLQEVNSRRQQQDEFAAAELTETLRRMNEVNKVFFVEGNWYITP